MIKKLSTYLFLILFSFQTLSWADDIREFKIEGISIGDSLLDHLSKSQIKKYTNKVFKTDEYITIQFPASNLNSKDYDVIEINYKIPNLVIENISGVKIFKEINQCYNKQDEILNEILELFSNIENIQIIEKIIYPHGSDKSGKSTYTRGSYEFPSGDKISVDCNYFSKKMNRDHQLYVAIDSKVFDEFLQSGRAY